MNNFIINRSAQNSWIVIVPQKRRFYFIGQDKLTGELFQIMRGNTGSNRSRNFFQYFGKYHAAFFHFFYFFFFFYYYLNFFLFFFSNNRLLVLSVPDKRYIDALLFQHYHQLLLLFHYRLQDKPLDCHTLENLEQGVNLLCKRDENYFSLQTRLRIK